MTNDPMTIGRAPSGVAICRRACRLLLSAIAPLLGLIEHALHGAERIRIRGLEDPVAAVIRIAGDRHAAKEAIAVAGGPPSFEQIIGGPQFAKPLLNAAKLGRRGRYRSRRIRRFASESRAATGFRARRRLGKTGLLHSAGRVRCLSIGQAIAVERISRRIGHRSHGAQRAWLAGCQIFRPRRGRQHRVGRRRCAPVCKVAVPVATAGTASDFVCTRARYVSSTARPNSWICLPYMATIGTTAKQASMTKARKM